MIRRCEARHSRMGLACLALLALLALTGCGGPPPTAPRPESPLIESLRWYPETLRGAAPGSDLWPNTWGPDGQLYLAWGDGAGFGGVGRGGPDRVSLGIARVEGPPEAPRFVNVNGGVSAEHPAQWDCEHCGKTAGLLSVDGVLYLWLNVQDDDFPAVSVRLAWSHDLGASWQLSPWLFPPGPGRFKPSSFLNRGRDHAGAPDEYVYFYGGPQSDWGEARHAYLGRVPSHALTDRSAYRFFTGTDAAGEPLWHADASRLRPVFSDPNGVAQLHVVYNPGLDRYLAGVTRGAGGALGVFDAPAPWGPWTTVAYYHDWLDAGGGEGLVYGFVPKWTSADGLTTWMIFSCYDCDDRFHDRFNWLKATFTLRR